MKETIKACIVGLTSTSLLIKRESLGAIVRVTEGWKAQIDSYEEYRKNQSSTNHYSHSNTAVEALTNVINMAVNLDRVEDSPISKLQLLQDVIDPESMSNLQQIATFMSQSLQTETDLMSKILKITILQNVIDIIDK
jgi:hypothetical protein